MSTRAVWDELVRRRATGQVDVPIQSLAMTCAYHHAGVTRLVRAGDLERIRPGVVRIADRALPAELREPPA